MQGDRWATLSPLLDELLELTGPAREQRLDEIEAADPELARELQHLMTLEEERPDFLSQPVVHAGLFSAHAEQEIGPYRLVSPLGEGGMGQVWLAVRADGLYERRVALKLLRPGLGDVGLHARFTRERQILARLGHAHIARLLDAGISQDGQPYLALDYVRGEPITDYAQKRVLDLRSRLHLFAQVCAAVSHAHANLVVHRDLKPSNILVTSAGEVCLLDFGIAKLLDQEQVQSVDITRTGSRTFTLHYASPEQLRGEVITTMTDVYALGVVLYELLTDSKPYELTRQSDAAWEEAILGTEPGRPSQVAARKARDSGSLLDKRRARLLAGDLDNIVLKALSKLPEQRYASVEALAQDLRRHLDGQPVQARAQSVGYRVRKYLRRHVLGLGMGVGVSGLLAVALGIVSWQATKALREATRAQAMQDFVIALFENSGNTSNSRGVDVRALLDAGVSRADTELASQPQARAELIGLIARLRSGLGDDAEALNLLDRQRQLFAQLGERVPGNLLLDSAMPVPTPCRPPNFCPSLVAATPNCRATRWRATCLDKRCSCAAPVPMLAPWRPKAKTTWPCWCLPASTARRPCAPCTRHWRTCARAVANKIAWAWSSGAISARLTWPRTMHWKPKRPIGRRWIFPWPVSAPATRARTRCRCNWPLYSCARASWPKPSACLHWCKTACWPAGEPIASSWPGWRAYAASWRWNALNQPRQRHYSATPFVSGEVAATWPATPGTCARWRRRKSHCTRTSKPRPAAANARR